MSPVTTFHPKLIKNKGSELRGVSIGGGVMGSHHWHFVLFLAFFPLYNALNDDGKTLMALSKSLILPSSVNTTWNSSDPNPCKWVGIRCDRSGFVVSVELPESGISGSLGKEIGLLSRLRKLDLGINNLSGIIPSELGNCSLLEHLDLAVNLLSDEIPETLQNLNKLSYLSVFENFLSGNIPNQLFWGLNLQTIFLNDNNLTGPIPSTGRNMSRIKSLWLSKNHLSGPLPDSVGNFSKLEELYLFENQLSGPLPRTLSGIRGLRYVDVNINNFVGRIPFEFSGLFELQLGGNKLGGGIPSSLGSLQILEKALNLSDNGLTGQIPGELGNLKMLHSLDISLNNLTGSLMPLSDLRSLTYVNVSYNNLTGPVPNNWLKLLELSPSSFMGNPELCISCQAADSTCTNVTSILRPCAASNNSKGLGKIAIVIIVLGSSLVCALVILLLGFILLKCTRRLEDEGPSVHEGSSFLLNQVIEATENLDKRHEIGRGAHGIVYKAVLNTGKLYAIKKLVFAGQKASNTSMVREIQTIGKIRHRNLVKLEKFWLKKDYGLILYEYMENGSLHDVLHELNPAPVLEWKVRYKIALGIAQGLVYLHDDCSPAIIHRDIKPKNILLDSDMEPHISDFGIAKLLDENSSSSQSTAIMGTVGYISPETAYTTRKSKESDVYSYGVVLLELLTRKKALDPSFPENKDIVNWVTSTLDGNGEIGPVVDQDLMNQVMGTWELEEVHKVLFLAMRCTAKEASRRPSMQNVVRELIDIKSKLVGSKNLKISRHFAS
ncbi:hypothetical protein C4D60_Mb06t00070 [Musa balbisiana]|uniref:non-specific serine/threonine protein kinase n=1 Tax=Musa balbisiana TaxID=52838 RepID=A0A4S8IKU8_MUSBA|nr:hypothetical protein C4D60_Mb06t00070 [Musa balbisiana]